MLAFILDKENLPMVPEEPEFEEDTTEALASLEPINTLVETLEKDITEIWSYKDLYPNAEALGLDNEKVILLVFHFTCFTSSLDTQKIPVNIQVNHKFIYMIIYSLFTHISVLIQSSGLKKSSAKWDNKRIIKSNPDLSAIMR